MYFSPLGFTPGRTPDVRDVDPRLVEIVSAGAQSLPPGYTVTINEGYNKYGHTSGSQHHVKGKGALDVQIRDPNGKVIPNEGADTTGMYQRLAQGAYGYAKTAHPELAGKFAWGGAFNAGTGKNPFTGRDLSKTQDLMHFDLGGERGGGPGFYPTLSRLGPLANAPTGLAYTGPNSNPMGVPADVGTRGMVADARPTFTRDEIANARLAPGFNGNQPARTMRKGMTGPDVRQLQTNLALNGYPVNPDGVYGRKTAQAVKAFERKSGLPQDRGVAGPQVLGALQWKSPITPGDYGANGPPAPTPVNPAPPIRNVQIGSVNGVPVPSAAQAASLPAAAPPAAALPPAAAGVAPAPPRVPVPALGPGNTPPDPTPPSLRNRQFQADFAHGPDQRTPATGPDWNATARQYEAANPQNGKLGAGVPFSPPVAPNWNALAQQFEAANPARGQLGAGVPWSASQPMAERFNEAGPAAGGQSPLLTIADIPVNRGWAAAGNAIADRASNAVDDAMSWAQRQLGIGPQPSTAAPIMPPIPSQPSQNPVAPRPQSSLSGLPRYASAAGDLYNPTPLANQPVNLTGGTASPADMFAQPTGDISRSVGPINNFGGPTRSITPSPSPVTPPGPAPRPVSGSPYFNGGQPGPINNAPVGSMIATGQRPPLTIGQRIAPMAAGAIPGVGMAIGHLAGMFAGGPGHIGTPYQGQARPNTNKNAQSPFTPTGSGWHSPDFNPISGGSIYSYNPQTGQYLNSAGNLVSYDNGNGSSAY